MSLVEYNATPPTVPTGTTVRPQGDSHGALKVIAVDSSTGLPLSTSSAEQVYIANSYLNIPVGVFSASVKAAPGSLAKVSINTKAASACTLTLYDSLAASGTKIGTIDLTSDRDRIYDVAFGIGLFAVVTTPGADLTISYR